MIFDLPHLTSLARHLGKPVYVFDLETTGFVGPRVVEIACLKARLDGHIVCKSTLVDPQKKIDPRAQKVHGISNSDVIGSKPFSDHFDFINTMYKQGIVSGYNVISYDMRIIRENAKHYGAEPISSSLALDVRDVWKKVSGTSSGKLVDVSNHYGVKQEQSHRAMGDVIMTAGVLNAMVRDHGIDLIVEHLREVS